MSLRPPSPLAVTPLVVTMGDPAGIGGDITLSAWLKRDRLDIPPFVVLDDPERLRTLAARLNLTIPIVEVSSCAEAVLAFDHALPVLAIPLPEPVTLGKPDPRNAPAILASIDRAVALVQAGEARAVVTNPIAKSVLYAAGFRHPGHTEYLAHLAGLSTAPIMMLACKAVKVIPVTVHLSLRDAVEALSHDAIVHAGQVTALALKTSFGIAHPRIAVAALNPHAGENGDLGREEIDIIAPAVAALKAQGIAAFGPQPADTLFHPDALKTFDACLCMYHDQALIPIKTLDFHRGVNVTLGLPFVRTSPDHGTAFSLAGTGLARDDSLCAALKLADEMAKSHVR